MNERRVVVLKSKGHSWKGRTFKAYYIENQRDQQFLNISEKQIYIYRFTSWIYNLIQYLHWEFMSIIMQHFCNLPFPHPKQWTKSKQHKQLKFFFKNRLPPQMRNSCSIRFRTSVARCHAAFTTHTMRSMRAPLWPRSNNLLIVWLHNLRLISKPKGLSTLYYMITNI